MRADYLNWFPLDTMEVRHLILVKDSRDADPGREKEKPLFRSVALFGEIQKAYAREKGTRIFLLLDARVSVNALLREEIAQKKSR